MDFHFIVNKDLLVACALFSKKGIKLEGWTNIKNSLWDGYREVYEFFLFDKSEKYFAASDYETKLKNVLNQIGPLFQACRESNEYKKLLSETEEYKSWLENEWDLKKELVLKEAKNILKIDLPDNDFTVQVVLPILGGGSYLGDYNIFWGHTEDWPNYSVVYLIHEALHELLGTSEKVHIAIELATDNELRKRLNNEDYFINGELVGHKENIEELKKSLPRWKEYINSESETIRDFIAEIPT